MEEIIKLYTPKIKKNNSSFIPISDIDILNVYITLKNNGYNVETLRKNIKSLKIKKANVKESTYSLLNNEIIAKKDEYKNNITHELLHCASNIVDGNAIHDGFFYGDFKTQEKIGTCLNEGMTATLDLELFGDYTDTKRENEEYVYPFAKQIIDVLELITPQSLLRESYFKSDLNAIVKDLERFQTREDIITFLKDLDCIFGYLDEGKELSESALKIVKKKFIRAQYILADTLYKALCDYLENNLIDYDEFEEYQQYVLTILETNLVLDGKTRTKSKIKSFEKIKENYKK